MENYKIINYLDKLEEEIKEGNYNILEKYDLNERFGDNEDTLLMISFYYKRYDLAIAIIKAGTNLNIKNKEGYNILYITSCSYEKTVFDEVLNNHVNILTKIRNDKNALTACLTTNDVYKINRLVARKATVEIKNCTTFFFNLFTEILKGTLNGVKLNEFKLMLSHAFYRDIELLPYEQLGKYKVEYIVKTIELLEDDQLMLNFINELDIRSENPRLNNIIGYYRHEAKRNIRKNRKKTYVKTI